MPPKLFEYIINKNARLVYKQDENFVEIPMRIDKLCDETISSEISTLHCGQYYDPPETTITFTGILSNDDLMRIYTPEAEHTSLISDDEWDEIMSKIRSEL